MVDCARLGRGVNFDGGSAASMMAGTKDTLWETLLRSKPKLEVISPHLLWSGPWACSNFYVVLSESGKSMFVDYGNAFVPHAHMTTDHEGLETARFVEHRLDELRVSYGVGEIDLVVPTHIHDDHTCGNPYLQRHYGTRCWALEEVGRVLVEPAAWASTPCLYPKPIRVDRRPDGKTVKAVLQKSAIPRKLVRRFPPYHEITVDRERREAVVALHDEGWADKSIAGYLRVDRSTVYRVRRRFEEEADDGLRDRSAGRPNGVAKVDLRAMVEARRMQENPDLGEYRVQAALEQMGIRLSRRTVGRILAANREAEGLPKTSRGRKERLRPRWQKAIVAHDASLIPSYPKRERFPESGTEGSDFFPDVVAGKKFTAVYDDRLRPLRNGIGHVFLEDMGDEGSAERSTDEHEFVDEVYELLPVAHHMARTMIQNDFGQEGLARRAFGLTSPQG